MARNPKPVRRRYKAAHAEIRRGTYKYPPPTYDQLNRRKFASVAYGMTCAVSGAAVIAGAAFQNFRKGLARAVEQVSSAMRREPTRDEFRLVE